LADQPFAARTRWRNEQRKTYLKAGIEALGIATYPSAANFLLLRLPHTVDATHFWLRMIREHHLVLRSCSNYEALSGGHLRTAVRTHQDNFLLVEALRKALL
jgi:threonine-phosphate decarboxylase